MSRPRAKQGDLVDLVDLVDPIADQLSDTRSVGELFAEIVADYFSGRHLPAEPKPKQDQPSTTGRCQTVDDLHAKVPQVHQVPLLPLRWDHTHTAETAEDRVRREAESLLRKHNLSDWTVEFGNAKVNLGWCDHSIRTIRISRVHAELDPPDEVTDTILHEIAHALCAPNEGHGATWKAKAREVGAKPERCAPSSRVTHRHREWRGTCPACHCILLRHRRHRVSCGQCSPGRYDDRFRFVWTRVDGGGS